MKGREVAEASSIRAAPRRTGGDIRTGCTEKGPHEDTGRGQLPAGPGEASEETDPASTSTLDLWPAEGISAITHAWGGGGSRLSGQPLCSQLPPLPHSRLPGPWSAFTSSPTAREPGSGHIPAHHQVKSCISVSRLLSEPFSHRHINSPKSRGWLRCSPVCLRCMGPRAARECAEFTHTHTHTSCTTSLYINTRALPMRGRGRHCGAALQPPLGLLHSLSESLGSSPASC